MHNFITRQDAWFGRILVMVLMIIGLKTSVAWAGPVTTQLAIVVDGSGSISPSEFVEVKNGFADAILSEVSIDGSVEITVIQFAGFISNTSSPDDITGARVEVLPTVINSSAVRDSVATAVRNIQKKNGTTPMAAGINLAVTKITGSSNFSTATRQLINLASDGAPNIPLNNGEGAALAAATAALAAGIDELDAEGTGNGVNFPSFQNFLCDLVYTSVLTTGCDLLNPGSLAFPSRNAQGIGTKGFVLLIEDLDDFAPAVSAKLDLLIESDPVADAGPIADGNPIDGPYGCFTNGSITLNGTGSFDPDNSSAANKGITAFAWSIQNSSIGGAFSGSTTIAQPSFTCPNATGTITVQLTVTKTGGRTNTDTAQIVVTTTPNPPVADAGPTPDGNKNDGPYSCKANSTIQLNGTGSIDPNNPDAPNKGITIFAWSIQSGGGSFGSTNVAQPQFTCPASGPITVKLIVTKTGGQTDEDTATINVVQPAGPIADAGADNICRAGQTVELDGTNSRDPDNDVQPTRGIGTFAWSIQSGGGNLADASTSTPTLTCPASGTVVAKLVVTDSDDSLTDDDTVTITVKPNEPPVADAGGSYICSIGQANITLNGTGSFDPDNQSAVNKGIVKYEWDLDNDGQFDDSTSATPSTTCPAESASKTVKLRVTDSDGATDDDVATIATPRLCAKTGKIDALLKDLLLKGFPFKDLFVGIRAELFEHTTELEDILDLISVNPSEDDLEEALIKLTVIDSIADYFAPFIAEIVSARGEYQCEIDVLKQLLPLEIANKKFGKNTGTRILRELDKLKKLLSQLAQLVAALEAKLDAVDAALQDAIDALQDNNEDEANAALELAVKLIDQATDDVDRMLRKQLSQVLRTQSTIEKTYKIELNNRKLGKKNDEPSVTIDQNVLRVQGLSVNELAVEVYTLSGARLTQFKSLSEHVALDSLMSPHAQGVYLYIVKVLDKNGNAWKSELKKLVWMSKVKNKN
jgi:predicted secreted protein